MKDYINNYKPQCKAKQKHMEYTTIHRAKSFSKSLNQTITKTRVLLFSPYLGFTINPSALSSQSSVLPPQQAQTDQNFAGKKLSGLEGHRKDWSGLGGHRQVWNHLSPLPPTRQSSSLHPGRREGRKENVSTVHSLFIEKGTKHSGNEIPKLQFPVRYMPLEASTPWFLEA